MERQASITTARYYSPQLGRFISEDPIGLGGGTHVYAYTDGNPISNTDPSGLITSVDFACARDPQFCLEISGKTPKQGKMRININIHPDSEGALLLYEGRIQKEAVQPWLDT